jgi:MerR family copper efflux transcriptional regulator
LKVKLMLIGELAKRAGVSTSKIRFYEARGLVPPASRQANGYRNYGDYALDVVTFVDRARSLGFSLRDIAAHLKSPQGKQRKARLQARLEAKLAELDAHMEQVRTRRAQIVELIAQVRQASGAR